MKLKYYYFVLLSFALTLVACDDGPVLLIAYGYAEFDPETDRDIDCLLHRIL